MKSNTPSAMPLTMKISAFVKQNPALMAVFIAILLYALTVIIVPSSFNIGAIATIFMLTLLLSFTSAGQTIVLIGGGLDFTVGAVMSTAAIITTTIMDAQDGRFLATFAVVMVMAVSVGLLNGLCTVKIGLPPLIVTMAIANVVTRLQYVVTQGSPVGFAGPAFISSINSRIFTYVPSIALYALIIFPLVFYILNRSRFGRQLYLVGNNNEAARLSGINTNKIKVLSYMFSAAFAGFAGMLGAGYMQSARTQMFDDYAFNSLVAVIVGGTAFTGGIGSYTGSIAGALLMVVLSNMLTIVTMDLPVGLSQPIRNIVMGAVMVLLLLLYNRKKPVRQ